MTDREKFKAEIEAVKLIIQANRAQGAFLEGYLIGQESVLEHFEKFIDSMQEEHKDKCAGCNNVKGCVTCVDGSEWAHIEECVSIDFEQELYKAFGQVKDFTLCMRIAKWFYDMGKNSQEPISENFEEAIAQEWKGYNDRGAATVDALEDNIQELAFAKGFYRGAKWQEKKDQDAVEIAMEEMIEKMQDWIADTFKYDGSNDFNGGSNDAMSMLLDDFTEYIKGQ